MTQLIEKQKMQTVQLSSALDHADTLQLFILQELARNQ